MLYLLKIKYMHSILDFLNLYSNIVNIFLIKATWSCIYKVYLMIYIIFKHIKKVNQYYYVYCNIKRYFYKKKPCFWTKMSYTY